jgi:hypothetical protein
VNLESLLVDAVFRRDHVVFLSDGLREAHVLERAKLYGAICAKHPPECWADDDELALLSTPASQSQLVGAWVVHVDCAGRMTVDLRALDLGDDVTPWAIVRGQPVMQA